MPHHDWSNNKLVRHNIITDCHKNCLSPIRARVNKATYTLTWDNLLPVKVFFFSSESKILEKSNSQYPSANDLVQQLLARATTWCQLWLHHTPCNAFGIKRKLTSVKNPQKWMLCWSIFMILTCYAHLCQWLEPVKPVPSMSNLTDSIWTIRSTYQNST